MITYKHENNKIYIYSQEPSFDKLVVTFNDIQDIEEYPNSLFLKFSDNRSIGVFLNNNVMEFVLSAIESPNKFFEGVFQSYENIKSTEDNFFIFTDINGNHIYLRSIDGFSSISGSDSIIFSFNSIDEMRFVISATAESDYLINNIVDKNIHSSEYANDAFVRIFSVAHTITGLYQTTGIRTLTF